MAHDLKVVFRSDVRGIAQAGEVKSVSPGYARNYLFPRKLAFPATETALRQWETERQGVVAKAAHRREEAQGLAQKIEAVACTVTAKAGDEGQLFGSINRQEILAALAKEGITLDKRDLMMTEPIKRLGAYTVPVRLAAGVQTQVKVNVVAEG